MGKRDFTFSGLVVLAIVANLAPVTIFFGVDFIFGSIFALVLVAVSGLWAGVLAAALAALCTVLYWEHLYAVPVFTLEVLVVGLLLGRFKKMPIVVADLIYWVIIGVPLSFFLYNNVLDTGTDMAKLIMFKQVLNGLFNASVASILLFSLQIFFSYATPRLPKPSLKFVLFSILAFVLIGGCVAVIGIESSRYEKMRTREICQNLDRYAAEARFYLENWHTSSINSALNISNVISQQVSAEPQDWLDDSGMLASMEKNRKIQLIAEASDRSGLGFHAIIIANANAITVASNPQVDQRTGQSRIGADFSDREYFQRLKATMRPFISDVFIGRFSDDPVITVSVPIMYAGEFIGYVLMAQRVEVLNSNLRTFQRDRNYNLNVLDRNENLIISTLPNNEKLEILSSTRLQPQTTVYRDVKHFAGRGVSNIDKYRQSYFGLARPAGVAGWQIAAAYPAHFIQAELIDFVNSSLLIVYIILLVGCPIAFIIASIFTSPIKSLSSISGVLKNPKLCQGAESIDWPYMSVEEIDSLSTDIKELIKQHADYISKLEEENQSLKDGGNTT